MAQRPIRHHIIQILSKVLDRQAFASEQINAVLQEEGIDARDRALLTQCVYGVLREKGFLDEVLSPYLKKNTPRLLRHGLRLGVYQILFLDRVPDHAALNETVEWAKKKGGRPWGGLVNAVLRKVLASRSEYLDERQGEAGHFSTFPPWLIRRWKGRYGPKQALALVQAFNQVPPLFLRTNLVKNSPDELKERLIAEGVSIQAEMKSGLFRIRSGHGAAVAGILESGAASLQDGHSYQITQKLSPRPGELGLDLCAGHGGKATAIAETLGQLGDKQADWSVWDRNPRRLEELKENFKRLGLPLPKIHREKPNFSQPYLDWILIDAPCTGLGTCGRKPEIRWRSDPRAPARMAAEQLALLREAASGVKVGGRLLYAVCSLEPEEGIQVIKTFLKEHSGWGEDEGGELWPDEQGSDAFYWARVKRKS